MPPAARRGVAQKPATAEAAKANKAAKAASGAETEERPPMRYNVLPRPATLLELLVAALVLVVAVIGFGVVNGGFGARKRQLDGLPFMNEDELSRHNGRRDSKAPYIALLGSVFEVTREFKDVDVRCLGRDCSRVLANGAWEAETLTSDVRNLSDAAHERLLAAVERFRRDYKHVAYVQGPFYDRSARATRLLTSIMAKAKRDVDAPRAPDTSEAA